MLTVVEISKLGCQKTPAMIYIHSCLSAQLPFEKSKTRIIHTWSSGAGWTRFRCQFQGSGCVANFFTSRGLGTPQVFTKPQTQVEWSNAIFWIYDLKRWHANQQAGPFRWTRCRHNVLRRLVTRQDEDKSTEALSQPLWWVSIIASLSYTTGQTLRNALALTVCHIVCTEYLFC